MCSPHAQGKSRSPMAAHAMPIPIRRARLPAIDTLIFFDYEMREYRDFARGGKLYRTPSRARKRAYDTTCFPKFHTMQDADARFSVVYHMEAKTYFLGSIYTRRGRHAACLLKITERQAAHRFSTYKITPFLRFRFSRA